MSNILEYKGYQASVEYSAEDGVLFGKILHIPSLILFEAENAADIVSAFHKAVDDYLEYCGKKGLEPNKAFSGTLNVRIGPERHRKIAVYATKNGLSLNEAICGIIDAFFSEELEENKHHPVILSPWKEPESDWAFGNQAPWSMLTHGGTKNERRH